MKGMRGPDSCPWGSSTLLYRRYGSEFASIDQLIIVCHSIQQGRKGIGEPLRCTYSRLAAAGALPKTLFGTMNVSRRGTPKIRGDCRLWRTKGHRLTGKRSQFVALSRRK